MPPPAHAPAVAFFFAGVGRDSVRAVEVHAGEVSQRGGLAGAGVDGFELVASLPHVEHGSGALGVVAEYDAAGAVAAEAEGALDALGAGGDGDAEAGVEQSAGAVVGVPGVVAEALAEGVEDGGAVAGGEGGGGCGIGGARPPGIEQEGFFEVVVDGAQGGVFLRERFRRVRRGGACGEAAGCVLRRSYLRSLVIEHAADVVVGVEGGEFVAGGFLGGA